MSLSQALAAAVSGLRANQAGMALIASNVANADTPGYVRKTLGLIASPIGNTAMGVRVGTVERQLNDYVLRQLRNETAGASYADTRAEFYQRLQQIYGQPGSASSISAVFDNFTAALQALSSSPADYSARTGVISAAQVLAQNLNVMSAGVQALRGDAENGLAAAVASANQAMQQIAEINQKLASSQYSDSTLASLLDQRDTAISKLSQLLDINVLPGDGKTVSIITTSGIQLVGLKASVLSFQPNGSITPEAQWSADPTRSAVGSIMLSTPNGSAIDLTRTRAIRSGEIAALLQLRDQDLVEAQNQLDAIAAAMASALSDRTTAGDPVTAPPQEGFDIDIGGLLTGNAITVNYRDGLTNAPRTIKLVRVDDPSLLPLPEGPVGGVTTFGIDFSQGFASVIAQIDAAIGNTGIQASTTGGTILRLLDDGAVNIDSLTTAVTATTFDAGSAELPLFQDNGQPYTGAYNALGMQSVGLAGRINVNAALIADPSKLVMYESGTPAGDATRPDFLYQQIANATLSFMPNSGIGTTASPYSGTIGSFLNQVISRQGEAASHAAALSEGQNVVINSIRERFNADANVNIDTEMTSLLNLQNAYAANARVMTVIKEMIDTILKM